MKQFNIFRGLILALLLTCCNAVWAYDIEIDGIYYNITSMTDLTVEVTNGDNEYSGDIVIPSTITYKSRILTVTSIGRSAFEGCENLTSVEIPNSVTSIASYAFYNCRSLTSIEIPSSVTSVGNVAFDFCSKLEEVHISNLTAWCNIKFDGIESNPLHAAKKLYLNGELITELVIPDDVVNIKDLTFCGCNITSLEIHNRVTKIGGNAFNSCSALTSVTIGNSVTTIGNNAFYACTNLTSVTIPNNVEYISDGVFSYCAALKNLYIKDGENALYLGCRERPLFSYREGKGLFYDCPLETVYIGRDLSYGSEHSAAYYGYSAFCKNTTLTNVVLGDSVTSVGMYAFKDCSKLSNIKISDSVTSIESYAFQGCKGVTSLAIPNNVTYIGDYVFQDCNSLEGIYVMAETPPSVSSDSFTESNYIISTIYVPTGCLEAYQNADEWKKFWEIKEFDTTGISDVKTENEKAATVYDINGHVVENPANGIYIIDGKKVLLR